MAASTPWGATSVPVHPGSSCTGTEKTVLVCGSTAPLWPTHWITPSVSLSALFINTVWFNHFVLPSELVKCPPGLIAPKATLTCSKTGKKESCSLTCASKAHYLAGMSLPVRVKSQNRTQQASFTNLLWSLLQSPTTATQSAVASPSSEESLLPGSTPAVVRAA